jgi:hypothetical protein
MEEAAFQITQFVRRPGIGRDGRPIRVRTNFFEVTTMPEMNITQYDVTITPEVPQRLNRKVFDRFVRDNQQGALGGAKPVYDGMYLMIKKKIFFQVSRTKQRFLCFYYSFNKISKLCFVFKSI